MRPSFLQIALLGGIAAGIATAVRKLNEHRILAAAPGSTTNAHDKIDDIELSRNPTADEVLDAGVKETFPASDPVSVSAPSETAYEKQQRQRRAGT